MRSNHSFVRSTLAVALMVSATGTTLAAGSGDPVRDSVQASGSASLALANAIVSVPVLAVYAGSTMTVAAIQVAGSGANLVLHGAGKGAEAVVTISSAMLHSIGLAVGQQVSVVEQGNGYLLVGSDRPIAYVPGANEASLLHSSRSF